MIVAEEVPTESFWVTGATMDGRLAEQRDELLGLFPELPERGLSEVSPRQTARRCLRQHLATLPA